MSSTFNTTTQLCFDNVHRLTICTLLLRLSSPAKPLWKTHLSVSSPHNNTLYELRNIMKAPLNKSEKKTARIWNWMADHYSKQPIQDEASYQKKLEITRKYLTPQTRLLEFGCGTGGTSLFHAPYVEHIHAIDVSQNMIDIAKGKLQNESNVNFECMGIDSLQVPPASYNIILGLSILHLLPNHKSVLRKVHGLLKPGGHFISSTTCMGDFARFLRFLPFSWFGMNLQVFTKKDLYQNIREAGFEIVEDFQPPGKDKAAFVVAKKVE